MNPRDIILRAILDAASLIRKLASAGDDTSAAEEALMQQAEDTKARLDELKFGAGPG